jgi:FO synthase subunit 1
MPNGAVGKAGKSFGISSHQGQVVTYSPAYTLVPTYECFNRCTYCNFRTDPGASLWLSIEAAEATLRSLQSAAAPTCEILILSGEVHPQSSRRRDWFEHIYRLCELALSLGFLPHTNVGPLSWEEMQQLKEVNVSMGLMLEQLTPVLLDTVHRHAPSKQPKLRLQQLRWAGELQIPFTTGLLLGLGESLADQQETLAAIAALHHEFGHIQEVILQPYSPGTREMRDEAAFEVRELVELVAIARDSLPDDITIQIPPNLVQHPEMLLTCLAAGARDLGGVSPIDEVNRDYPHPLPNKLQKFLQESGWVLKPRLPVYPHHYNWLNPALKASVDRWEQVLLG